MNGCLCGRHPGTRLRSRFAAILRSFVTFLIPIRSQWSIRNVRVFVENFSSSPAAHARFLVVTASAPHTFSHQLLCLAHQQRERSLCLLTLAPSREPPSSPPAAKKPKPDDQEAPNKPATMGGAHEQADKNHTDDEFPNVMPCKPHPSFLCAVRIWALNGTTRADCVRTHLSAYRQQRPGLVRGQV